jgi:hypothetical protein
MPTPTPAVTFTRLTGYGYTIESPSSWTSTRDTTTAAGVSVLLLSDTSSLYTDMSIGTDTRGNPVPPLDEAQSLLNLSGEYAKNFQKKSVPATVTINGVQWAQVAGTMEKSGTSVKSTMYVLATLFPSDATKVVSIEYTAPTREFDQVNTEDFQPMLLSFKFT